MSKSECERHDCKVAKAKARIAGRYIDGLPFCPDHRDKVRGKSCRECEIERLEKDNAALADALQELHDIQNGPALPKYAESHARAMDKASRALRRFDALQAAGKDQD